VLALLLLPVLISGYVVFTTHPYHFYRLHRYDGQLLYLESAKFGFYCTLVSCVLILILNGYMPPYLFGVSIDIYSYVHHLMKKVVHDSASSLTWILLISLLSLVVAWAYVTLAKIKLYLKVVDVGDYVSMRRIRLSLLRKRLLPRTDKSKLTKKSRARILLMGSILRDSPMESLFFRSYIEDGFYLMLTMDDRKVYIGRVISLGEPNENKGMDQDISITPYASGYRDKDNLGVTLTTKYSDVSLDISLTLRQDKIVGATHFSPEIYDEFLKRIKGRFYMCRAGR